MNQAQSPDPAVEPLKDVLGYLTEVVRLDERVVERLSDHQLASGHHFVLHQHELHGLPGVTLDSFDEDGAIWLAVSRLKRDDPPAVERELEAWINLSAGPDQRPAIRDSVLVTVDAKEKDRLVAAEEARAEDCSPAQSIDGPTGEWDVRLRVEDRPNIAGRLEAYVSRPWASWAATERPRRRTMAIYQRLFEIAQLADLGGSHR